MSRETKYSVPDGHWDEDDESEETPERTQVHSHEIEVYYDTEPDPEDNYGREMYTVTVTCNDDGPSVLYAVEHRWKGNYWRDVTDWDWRDLPGPVRQCVANALPVESPDDLDGGVRLMDEGGESRWEKVHKPRVDDMSRDQMWGTSFLRNALHRAESAAEAFGDGSEGKRRAESIVADIQSTISEVEEVDDDGE